MHEKDDRFKGFSQLVGEQAFCRIQSSSVCVVGLGGVGSWVVEALARSGVGALTLVDLDEVCITNINRQVQATSSTVGELKADLLARRVRDINPDCLVQALPKFFTRSSVEHILGLRPDLVVDTIDRAENKALLIAECVARGIRVVTAGSAGDRLDPSAVTSCDLSLTVHDPLLQIVRKDLRGRYGFPRGDRSRFNVPCVYVPKQRNHSGTQCEGAVTRKSCNDGLGSAVFVTGAVGFMAASVAVRMLAEDAPREVYPWYRKRLDALADGGEIVVARNGCNLNKEDPEPELACAGSGGPSSQRTIG